MINTKVMKMLKTLDPEGTNVIYTESGMANHNPQRRHINQDDLRNFIQKAYGNEI